MLKIGSVFCNMCAIQKGFLNALTAQGIAFKYSYAIENDLEATEVHKIFFDTDIVPLDKVHPKSIEAVDILLVGYAYFENKDYKHITQNIIKQTTPQWIIFETGFDYFSTNKHTDSQYGVCDFLMNCGYFMDFYPLNTKYFDTPLDKNQVFIIAHFSDQFPNWIANTDKIKMFNIGFEVKYEVNKYIEDILEPSDLLQDHTNNRAFSYSDINKINKLLLDKKKRNFQIFNMIFSEKILFVNGLCPPIDQGKAPLIVDTKKSFIVPAFKYLSHDNPKDIDLFSNDHIVNAMSHTDFTIRELSIVECMALYGFTKNDYIQLSSSGVSDQTILNLLSKSTHINMVYQIAKCICQNFLKKI
jgi:site-specific DNA-cytosine methylase